MNGLGQSLFQYLGASATYSLATCGRYIRFSLDPYNGNLVFARNDWNVGVIGARGTGNGQFLNPSDLDIYYWDGPGLFWLSRLVIADTGNNRLAFIDFLDLIIYVGGQEPCSYKPGSSPKRPRPASGSDSLSDNRDPPGSSPLRGLETIEIDSRSESAPVRPSRIDGNVMISGRKPSGIEQRPDAPPASVE